MKKLNFRPLIWIALIALSIFSYKSIANASIDNAESYAVEYADEIEPTTKDSKVLLPDLALVKKVIDIAELILQRD